MDKKGCLRVGLTLALLLFLSLLNSAVVNTKLLEFTGGNMSFFTANGTAQVDWTLLYSYDGSQLYYPALDAGAYEGVYYSAFWDASTNQIVFCSNPYGQYFSTSCANVTYAVMSASDNYAVDLKVSDRASFSPTINIFFRNITDDLVRCASTNGVSWSCSNLFKHSGDFEACIDTSGITHIFGINGSVMMYWNDSGGWKAQTVDGTSGAYSPSIDCYTLAWMTWMYSGGDRAGYCNTSNGGLSCENITLGCGFFGCHTIHIAASNYTSNLATVIYGDDTDHTTRYVYYKTYILGSGFGGSTEPDNIKFRSTACNPFDLLVSQGSDNLLSGYSGCNNGKTSYDLGVQHYGGNIPYSPTGGVDMYSGDLLPATTSTTTTTTSTTTTTTTTVAVPLGISNCQVTPPVAPLNGNVNISALVIEYGTPLDSFWFTLNGSFSGSQPAVNGTNTTLSYSLALLPSGTYYIVCFGNDTSGFQNDTSLEPVTLEIITTTTTTTTGTLPPVVAVLVNTTVSQNVYLDDYVSGYTRLINTNDESLTSQDCVITAVLNDTNELVKVWDTSCKQGTQYLDINNAFNYLSENCTLSDSQGYYYFTGKVTEAEGFETGRYYKLVFSCNKKTASGVFYVDVPKPMDISKWFEFGRRYLGLVVLYVAAFFMLLILLGVIWKVVGKELAIAAGIIIVILVLWLR